MKVFERIEEALVRQKKYQAAEDIQRFLATYFTSYGNDQKQKKWIRGRNLQNEKGITILQREVYLKKEIDGLEKLQKLQKLTEAEQGKLDGFKEELQKVDGEWWLHKRAMGKLDHEKPKGALIRWYETTGNPHKDEWRKSHCRSKGGCCSYDCGCCEGAKNSPRSPPWRYHCSEECPCCIKRRGFRKIPQDA